MSWIKDHGIIQTLYDRSGYTGHFGVKNRGAGMMSWKGYGLC